MRNTDLGMRHLEGVDFSMTARMEPLCGAIRDGRGRNPAFRFATYGLHSQLSWLSGSIIIFSSPFILFYRAQNIGFNCERLTLKALSRLTHIHHQTLTENS